MATTDIKIRGAREHNLRDVSLDLPRGALICFTGVSGSGKSSLAFDTLYRRGAAAVCREPVELRPPVPRPDAQARGRPDRRPEPVDLDPAEDRRPEPPVAPSARSPRSTTTSASSSPGSARGIARTATGRSPRRPASRSSRGSRACRRPTYSILAPVIRGQKGEYKDLFDDLAGRLRPGPGRRQGRRPDRPAEARPPDQAPHRGRHRPPQGRRGRAGPAWPRRSRRP